MACLATLLCMANMTGEAQSIDVVPAADAPPAGQRWGLMRKPLLASRAAAIRLERDREAAALLVQLEQKPADEGDDFNSETSVEVDIPVDGLPEDAQKSVKKWTKGTKLPFSYEAVIACCWVGFVGAMPLVILAAEGKRITSTQVTISVVMWIVYFGGVVLFTNVIYFQSSHFEHDRTLTMVECVYLMSQILTTVGYGDITPSRPRGQVFVAVYVFIAIMIIANIVSEVSSLVVAHTADYANKLREEAVRFEEEVLVKKLAVVKKEVSHRWHRIRGMPEEDPSATPEQCGVLGCTEVKSDDLEVPTLPPLEWKPMLISIVAFSFFVGAGWAFFVYYPGEEKTALEGCYMSVITLSTVGFGAVTPATEAGKVFAAFWMLFGTGALVNVVSKFTEMTVNMKARERFAEDYAAKTEAARQIMDDMLQDIPERMDYRCFLKVGLCRFHLVEKVDIDYFEDMYDKWMQDEQTKDGMVAKSRIVSMKYTHRPQEAQQNYGKGKFSRHVNSDLKLPSREELANAARAVSQGVPKSET